MTIIAWDGKSLAADRMCVDHGIKSETRKIKQIETGEVIAFVGSLEIGMLLGQWYENGKDPAKWPKEVQISDKWSTLIIASNEGCFVYEQQPVMQKIYAPFYAWGSGAEVAIGAMEMGATAVKAVEVASKHENQCGLGVDVYVLGE